MSEYIKREDAEKLMRYDFFSALNEDERVAELDRIPSADVVEVVRCKDCMYNDRGWCGSQEYGTRHVEDNDYCSCGERKDGDKE